MSALCLIGKNKLHLGKGTQSASIVREMTAAKHGGLGTNEKIGQNGTLLTFGRGPTTESNTRSPCSLEIQFHPPEQSKLLIHSFTDPSASRQFRVSHRPDRKLIFVDPFIERFTTTHVMFVIGIHPRNDHRRIDENHGRVRRNNSAPEILPSHLPACSRMCFCAAVGGFAFFATRTWPLPSTDHSITVSGPIPAFFAIFAGMFAFPLEMTVSVGMVELGYRRSPCGSISGRAAVQRLERISGVRIENGVKTPNTKHQTPKNFQPPNPNKEHSTAVEFRDWRLEIGDWSFVGVWCLVFGI
jgi:hypothetical protein